MADSHESTSKFLSYVLRHKPDSIDLNLDSEGWAAVDELITRANESGHDLTLELTGEVVANNDKKRFALSEDGTRIRANQGHSVTVDLGLAPIVPPGLLYHGTATRFVDSIRKKGLVPGSRRHVHLSADHETAVSVGRRHGSPTVLLVKAPEMARSGYEFFVSDNGVWLTSSVPPEYIVFEAL